MAEITPARFSLNLGWDDCPHLDAATKKTLLDATPPYLREARTKGVPSLGAGAIYPIQWSDVTEPPFSIPDYWPRAYALDVGWQRTAALWGAWEPETTRLHVYAEHYRGQAEPVIHAAAIKARGEWVRGVVDPASRGRSQRDGEQLFADYARHGLMLTPADNAVEAGLLRVWELLSTGRLVFWSTLLNLRNEYQFYRRDEQGRIVKEHDHLMDALRYLVMSGRAVARVRPFDGMTPAAAAAIADQHAGY